MKNIEKIYREINANKIKKEKK
jgi:hypothetical protein